MPYSVIKCSTWLGRFLQSRGLSTPDQRGLYAYHCSLEEYSELQHLLRELDGFEAASKDPAACACLVLFGSEWYRREYRSEYAWTWDPIWKALGFRLSPVELSKSIPKGLEGYWKRPLHLYDAGHRDFLGSLFSEGGLPFQVLREGDSRFQTLFDRLLKYYDQWHLQGGNTLQQVEQQLDKSNLPQVFASRTSVELIARMADELVALVRNYGLTQANEPVTHLDAMNPKWRELFPLPLDNQTGSELLNGLLKTATSEGKRRASRAAGWVCQHFWHESMADVLKVQVSLPEEVVFRLTTQPSTTRFELAIAENGQVIAGLGPGYAQVDNGVARIRLRLREIVGKRRDCSLSLSLVAMAGGRQIATLPIDGSAVALGEVPLGFELMNERWRLCGQASFNTVGEELLLVLPDGCNLSAPDSRGEAIFSDMPPALSRRTVKVQGKAEVLVEGEDCYRIRTGHVTGMVNGPELTGVQIEWPSKPSLIFVGLPRVQWPAAAGELQQRGGELYIAGKQPGTGKLQEVLGTQYISVRNRDGDTLLRRRVGILPTNFRVELRSGETPETGSILVYCEQRCLLQIDGESLQVQQVRHEDHIELRLSANAFPPIRVRLSVMPNLMADPVEIDLPFPSSGCLAFDGNGEQLKRTFSVDDLLGARLFLFGRSGTPTRFSLELTLRGSVARNACYSWSYIAADKPFEISLFNIREQIVDLLSLQSGIDQVVEMRVFGNGQDSRYRIRKYAMEMQLDHGRQLLSAVSLQDGAGAIPEPVLMLLHDPMRSSIAIRSRTSEGVLTGDFELPPIVERDGPWLVLPRGGSTVSFRPLFLAGGSEPIASDEMIQSLQKAVLTFDHASPVSSFTSVLDAMAINPMHSGWQFLRALYEGYGYLPLATFEVWKALVGNTRALAMALFKFEMEAVFLGRLESEFPLFWEFLPIAEIHLAAKRFAAFLKVKGVSAEAVDALVGRMFSRLGETYPSYGQSVQCFLSGKPVGQEIKLPLVVFKEVLRGWYLELLRDRCEAQWPEFGAKRLERWYSSQSDSVIVFRSDMDYRNAVLYLPLFAAAVACGKAQFTDVFADGAEAIFFLRQVRDFDSKWFNSIFQYCLLNSVMEKHKAESVNG